MYKKNKRSQQPLLLSDVNDLPVRTLKILKNSWAETFRREVFFRIPEDRFAKLYDPYPSRPNVPVNVLMGLEILKEWHGWSDEEMYAHFLFDLQVRYALGCDNFGEGDFDLRTVYYFRRRLSEHALKTGENLVKGMFEHITDEQVRKLGINTKMQRMDSTQLLSNIADLSRLELLVEALQRLYRILSEADQAKYAEVFRPYIQESAGQYTYRIRGMEAVWQHIEALGKVLYELLGQLEGYQAEAVYQIVQRFFAENFTLIEKQVKAKTNREITAGCLQSLDDLEATYRVKCNRAYKGFVANVTETCDPANPVQLIDDVQTAVNRETDNSLLHAALPRLVERTGMNLLVTDGGYISQENDEEMRSRDIEHITTGLTGTLPNHEKGKKALSDFEMELDREGNVTKAICPAGHAAVISPSASGKSFKFTFAPAACLACAFYQADQCPVQTNKRKSSFFLPVPKDRARSSQRRRRFESCKEEARALRPAVEATIFQVKHTLRGGKMRVRGLFRTACVITCSALAVNLRRIYRYENDQLRGKLTSKKASRASSRSFLAIIWAWFQVTLAPPHGFDIYFGHERALFAGRSRIG
jgi:hypothetical protein